MNMQFCWAVCRRMALILGAFWFQWSAFGTSIGVTIANFAFAPASVTVNQGDSVVWTQKDAIPHTSTSDTAGVWDSGLLMANKTFSFTFSTAGSFPYHCTVHPFMKASVTVQSAPVTPPPTNAPPPTTTPP